MKPVPPLQKLLYFVKVGIKAGIIYFSNVDVTFPPQSRSAARENMHICNPYK
jgi:hypothetical protein